MKILASCMAVLFVGLGSTGAGAEQTLRIGNNISIINGVVSGTGTAGMVSGSGKVTQSRRQLEKFGRIQIDLTANVKVTRGQFPACTLQGDDNILPLIVTEVRGATLHIRAEKSYSSSRTLQIQIVTPGIQGLVLGGSGTVELDGVTDQSLDIRLEGSGDIMARGRVGKLKAVLDGSGNMDLSGLRAVDADAALEGSGDLLVHASGGFKGVLNGSGDIIVSGGARINRADVNGAGEIVTD